LAATKCIIGNKLIIKQGEQRRIGVQAHKQVWLGCD